MLEINTTDWLAWVPVEATLSEAEVHLNAKQLSLGPIVRLARQKKVRELMEQRVLVRSNSTLGRIEEMVAAFEYVRDGATHRTFSSPREACGPELRQRLYATPDVWRAAQLRVVRQEAEHWWQFEAPTAQVAQSFVRSVYVAGAFARSVVVEGANGWLGFAGPMTVTYAKVAEQIALQYAIRITQSAEPSARLHSDVPLTVCGWGRLPRSQTFYLADPWAVLAKQDLS